MDQVRKELKTLEAMDVASASASDIRRAWQLMCMLEYPAEDEPGCNPFLAERSPLGGSESKSDVFQCLSPERLQRANKGGLTL